MQVKDLQSLNNYINKSLAYRIYDFRLFVLAIRLILEH